MFIALDYDDTYTVDPAFWEEFKKLASKFGHGTVCITKRGENNKGLIKLAGWDVVHTNRRAKAAYCRDKNIDIDVWIDDTPHNIIIDG